LRMITVDLRRQLDRRAAIGARRAASEHWWHGRLLSTSAARRLQVLWLGHDDDHHDPVKPAQLASRRGARTSAAVAAGPRRAPGLDLVLADPAYEADFPARRCFSVGFTASTPGGEACAARQCRQLSENASRAGCCSLGSAMDS
jgi:hypothetical protein